MPKQGWLSRRGARFGIMSGLVKRRRSWAMNAQKRNVPSGKSHQIRRWPVPLALLSSPCFTHQNNEFWPCTLTELRWSALSCRENWLPLLFVGRYKICLHFICFGFRLDFQKVYFLLSRAEPPIQMC